MATWTNDETRVLRRRVEQLLISETHVHHGVYIQRNTTNYTLRWGKQQCKRRSVEEVVIMVEAILSEVGT